MLIACRINNQFAKNKIMKSVAMESFKSVGQSLHYSVKMRKTLFLTAYIDAMFGLFKGKRFCKLFRADMGKTVKDEKLHQDSDFL